MKNILEKSKKNLVIILTKISNFKICRLKYLLALYDNCLALIYSSFGRKFAALEAMARKKKIICSNYPGVKQLGNHNIFYPIANIDKESINKIFKSSK